MKKNTQSSGYLSSGVVSRDIRFFSGHVLIG